MYWRDTVTLKAISQGRDADGYPVETAVETEVYADVTASKRSEYYAAKQIGVDLAITVNIRAADYNSQERLIWSGKEYIVERAYTKAREFYELNCSEFKGATA